MNGSKMLILRLYCPQCICKKSIEGKQCSVTDNICFPQNSRLKQESLGWRVKGETLSSWHSLQIPQGSFPGRIFPWWWLPKAICSGVKGVVAVLDNQFMKDNAISFLVLWVPGDPREILWAKIKPLGFYILLLGKLHFPLKFFRLHPCRICEEIRSRRPCNRGNWAVNSLRNGDKEVQKEVKW